MLVIVSWCASRRHYQHVPESFASQRMIRKAGGQARNVLCLLPADWYLPTFLSLTIFTEILHFVQNDSEGGKAKHVTLLL